MLFEQRTNTCGELRAADIGKSVVLNGWVHRKRDHGGITFINIRDRYGVTQVVVDADSPRELLDIAADLKMEYCLSIRGTVRPRPDTMVNPSMPTGEIEVKAERIQILSRCAPLPFMIDESTDAKEDMRLTYRYLDLRSFSMQKKSACATRQPLPCANTLSAMVFTKSRRRRLSARLPKARATTLCPQGSTPENSTRFPSRHSFTSKSLWYLDLTNTSSLRAVIATRTRAATGSLNSPRSISK